MTRVYVRKFDHDEARRLHAEGMSYGKIAALLDVSASGVARVCNPEIDATMRAHTRRYWTHPCHYCGKPCQWNKSNKNAHAVPRCYQCAAEQLATTVAADSLRCQTCRNWKPDTDFPRDKRRIARRGRHRQCTACQTKAKADWRARHREHSQAYDREYGKSRRSAA